MPCVGGTVAVLDRLALPVEDASQALARRATGGDDDAFEALVRRYQRRVHGFAYQHLHDPDEAQDLAQEIFVRLYRALARYDSARPFDPWFWKLATNVSLNYLRRNANTPAPDPGEGWSGDAPQPEAAQLQDALSDLEPRSRLALLLHYYSGLSLEEVASTLGLSVPALKSRMHRARATLRRALVEAAP